MKNGRAGTGGSGSNRTGGVGANGLITNLFLYFDIGINKY